MGRVGHAPSRVATQPGRDVMERAIREAGARQLSTTEQSNALLALFALLYLRTRNLLLVVAVLALRCPSVCPSILGHSRST